ncbi:MAG TPA: M48 family metallopeptidase [Vicinamibacterales bacterium]|nr:M48 family metallopeptidase [Vicinamibacterales bacterium]
MTDVRVWIVPVLIALVPAVVRLWSGRTLVAHLDDPALPERTYAAARQGALVVAFAAALIIIGFPGHAIWAVPFMLVARMAAGYPARRALLDESWSLGAYLWFYLRLIGAWWGFWIALAFLPTIANREGVTGWTIAGIGAALLFAWNHRFGDVLRFLMSTRPVESPALLRRFEALADAAGLPQPWFDQVDLRGGVLANAVALPSLRRSAVVFTETLLDRLEPDEAAAVCAHELAHLEYYARSRLTRLYWAWVALIGIGAVLSPVLRQWQPAWVDAARMIWPFALAAVLVVVARHRQQNETASDLRALALTGDAEALIGGLTKLHTIARVPRRWNAEAERQATHPSLARRIQAIRRAAGAAPASIETARRFESSRDARLAATFDRGHLVWHGANGDERIAYETIQEGRVEISRGAPRLIAVASDGRRRELWLRAEDVRAVQQALDVIDTRFSAVTGTTRTAAAFSRVAVAITAIAALMASHLVLLALALVALARPVTPIVAASGAAALVSGVLAWRDRDAALTMFAGDNGAAAVLLPLAGVLLLLLAFMRRAEPVPNWIARAAPWFAVLVLPIVLAPFAGATNVFALHQAARAWPAVVALPIAAAVLNLFRGARAGTLAAASSVVIAAATAFLGSTAALDLFSNDPLRASAAPAAFAEVDDSEIGRVTVPFAPTSIRLSPDARALLLIADQDDPSNVAFAGRVGAPFTRVDAADGVFVDDRRLVLMTRHETHARVSLLDLETMTPAWITEVPEIGWARLSLDRAGDRWSLLGYGGSPGARLIQHVRGNLAGDVVDRREWDPMLGGHRVGGQAIALTGNRVVVWTSEYQPSWMDRIPLGLGRRSDLLGRTRSRLLSVGPSDTREILGTNLVLNCPATIEDEVAPVCSAFDGHETRVLRVDPASGGATPVLSMAGDLYLEEYSTPRTLAGWTRRGPFALDLESRDLVFPPGHAEDEWQMASGAGVVAIGSPDGDGEVIRIYRVLQAADRR